MRGRSPNWYESEDGKMQRGSRMLELGIENARERVERETAIFLERVAKGSPRLVAMTYASREARKVPLSTGQVCIVCGETFAQSIRGHVICSYECRKKRNAQAIKQRYVPVTKPVAECPKCHKQFTKTRSDKLFCTRKCLKLSINDAYRRRQKESRSLDRL